MERVNHLFRRVTRLTESSTSSASAAAGTITAAPWGGRSRVARALIVYFITNKQKVREDSATAQHNCRPAPPGRADGGRTNTTGRCGSADAVRSGDGDSGRFWSGTIAGAMRLSIGHRAGKSSPHFHDANNFRERLDTWADSLGDRLGDDADWDDAKGKYRKKAVNERWASPLHKHGGR